MLHSLKSGHRTKRTVGKQGKIGLRARISDEVKFIRNWIGQPLVTGAVSPSGPALTKRMASFVDPEATGPIVELGPGTGVVTEALLRRGVKAERIVAIEYNEDFCEHLRHRFHGVNVVRGDAYHLDKTLDGHVEGKLTAVVSSLPLFTRPAPERAELINTALDMLEPGAPFIQFSYALVPPVPLSAGDFTLERTRWVVLNLPPARVWVYRRPA